MLIVAGHILIEPTHRSAATDAARVMMAATRAEPGCISYTITADLEDDSLFHVFEEWRSAEDLQGHFHTPHMATFRHALAGMGLHDARIQQYAVASSGPLGG